MCGICGELRLDGAAPDLTALRRMMDALRFRGPDHSGSYSDGPLAFGHRRLSIIDLSPHAHQPMVDAELCLTVVFNGTIYNYRELRSELVSLGYRFFSTGDTEVILKAFHAWGPDCVNHFVGMFAFAVWDAREQKLFLARDRLGIKPLYFTQNEGGFRFASSTQALLAAGGVDKRIDPVALHHQLSLHAVVPAPRTVLSGIRKLAPAHTLTIGRDGRQKLERYWNLDARRPDEPRSEGEWASMIRIALVRAVQRRLSASDVPVGVLLSGGLDSSLLVGLLAEAGNQRLKTFSVGFEGQPEEQGDEFRYSDAVVERFGTEHHKLLIPNDEVLKRLPEAVEHMSEPMVGQDAVAFYLLAEQVSRSVKVVQSGQGADEVFGGYFWYPRMAAETRGTAIHRFRKHYFDRSQAEFAETVHSKYVNGDPTSRLMSRALAEPYSDSFIDAVLRLDVTTLIVDDPVKRVDNMTMAFGLEARTPFLDHELVELAARMPPEFKLKGDGKYILKRIARTLLPREVIDRPKGYFPLPALKYVRGPFLELMADVLNSQACRNRGLFRRTYVNRLLSKPQAYFTALNGSKLWHLAALELWLQRNVDSSP
jgi:asparagine synthase (glutamine-hydrolysing)